MGEAFPFRDCDLSIDRRVEDLLARLTLREKAAQLLHESPAIERFDIPAYNWWNECLHGVARAGVATVFPQAIGLAATWDDDLLHRVAVAISDEARAKHHEMLRQGDHGYYKGLTFWSPNINIFRDPRWGRGHETYGECPFLTGRMGVAFCRGLQGDDPRHLKLVATPKHYAVHSGPEGLRHRFDAQVSAKDLRETYLPAFRDCVKEAGAFSIMGAYNRVLGEPCCGSRRLLEDILRREWGFAGYVVSDCGAINDFHAHHHATKDAAESAALAVKMGCDLNCGCTYEAIGEAVERGLLAEAEVDACLRRLLTARFRLGMFDPPAAVAYAAIPFEIVNCQQHRRLALQAARASIVLLKNRGHLLPLARDLASVAVVGPNAHAPEVLLGNYNGQPNRVVTPLEGIRAAVAEGTRVLFTPGCHLTATSRQPIGGHSNIAEAVAMAQRADLIVAVVGLSPQIEGEEGDTANPEAAGDKTSLDLPGDQQRLLEALSGTGKPLVVVLVSGSALAVTWAEEHADAVIQAFYGGEAAGTALAEVLFGECNPAGRLPVTYVRSLAEVPDFQDYRMTGRSYRYLDREPLYPFGYGLSYTHFAYHDLRLSTPEIACTDTLRVSVAIENLGDRAGDEVAQCYLRHLDVPFPIPRYDLRGFRRIHLRPGEVARVEFTLDAHRLSLIDPEGRRIFRPGRLALWIGGSQPDPRSVALTGVAPLAAHATLIGSTIELPY